MTQPFVYEIIRSPIITEKSTQLTEQNKYVFKVAIDATKPQIKHALKKLFNVDVKAVNIIVVPGKVKRFRGQEGQRSDYKKAIVTLAKGQSVDYTSGV